MTYLLTALLALSVGWCWGHTTARVRVRFVGARPADDQAAIDEAEERFIARIRADFAEITDSLHLDEPADPDDPRSAA